MPSNSGSLRRMTCLASRGSRIIVPAGLAWFWEPMARPIIADIGHISESVDYPLVKISTCNGNDSCYGGSPLVRKESHAHSNAPRHFGTQPLGRADPARRSATDGRAGRDDREHRAAFRAAGAAFLDRPQAVDRHCV